MGYPDQGGVGVGFQLGDEQNVFTGSTRVNAESARDTYASANASWLASYNTDKNLNIRIEYTSGTTKTAVNQVRNAAGNGWADNGSFIALKGDPGEVASLQNVTVGHVPYKLTDNTLGDSGAQVLDNGNLLLPKGLGVESASIEFGDITTLSEANSFLRISNTQFPNTKFDILDARQRSTGVSSRPRQFVLTEAENPFTIQPTDTSTITTNPLLFNYTATLNSQTNKLRFRTGAAMVNVRLRVRYNASPNAVVKYIPDKASWLSGTGGLDLTSGDNTVDLGNSPFRSFVGDVYQVEVRADNMSLKGTATIPYVVVDLQRGEFRDMAYQSDLANMTGSVVTKVFYLDGDQVNSVGEMRLEKTGGGLVQANDDYSLITRVKFFKDGASAVPVSAGSTAVDNTNLLAGIEVGGIIHMTSTSEGTDELNFNVTAVNAVVSNIYSFDVEEIFHKGTLGGVGRSWTVAIKGKDDIVDPDDVIGLEGNNKYVGTDASGNAGIHDLPAAGGLDVKDNNVNVKVDAMKLNIVGNHHALAVDADDSEQVNLSIDPGSLMLRQNTGLTMLAGTPAIIGSSGGLELALNIAPSGATNNWPTLWCGQTLVTGNTGEFVSEGRINSCSLIEQGTGQELITPTTQGKFVYWRQSGGIFTIVDHGPNEPLVGNVINSRYKRTHTNVFDANLNNGGTGVSTGPLAEALRNGTVVAPAKGSAFTSTFQFPNLLLDQVYSNPFIEGDTFAFVSPDGYNHTLTVTQQTGGNMRNLSGSTITSYAVAPNNAVVFEVKSNTPGNGAGDYIQVVAEDSDVVESDIVVSFDRMANARDNREDTRLLANENSIAALQAAQNSLTVSHFRGLDTYSTSNTALTIQTGSCGSDDGTTAINVTSDITINTGDLDTGSEAANTWYYVWLFKGTSGTGVVARLSTSNSSPTVPSGYSAKRMIGAVRNDNSSNFRQFRCQGAGASKFYTYNTEFLTLDGVSLSSRTAVTVTAEVPILPVTGYPYLEASFEYSGGALVLYHADNTGSFVFIKAGGEFAAIPHIQLNASGQFHMNNSGSNVTGLYMKVTGFNMELH